MKSDQITLLKNTGERERERERERESAPPLKQRMADYAGDVGPSPAEEAKADEGKEDEARERTRADASESNKATDAKPNDTKEEVSDPERERERKCERANWKVTDTSYVFFFLSPGALIRRTKKPVVSVNL